VVSPWKFGFVVLEHTGGHGALAHLPDGPFLPWASFTGHGFTTAFITFRASSRNGRPYSRLGWLNSSPSFTNYKHIESDTFRCHNHVIAAGWAYFLPLARSIEWGPSIRGRMPSVQCSGRITSSSVDGSMLLNDVANQLITPESRERPIARTDRDRPHQLGPHLISFTTSICWLLLRGCFVLPARCRMWNKIDSTICYHDLGKRRRAASTLLLCRCTRHGLWCWQGGLIDPYVTNELCTKSAYCCVGARVDEWPETRPRPTTRPVLPPARTMLISSTNSV
jgi:hypothetical protein